MIAELADRQEGVVGRAQLLAARIRVKAIEYRVSRKRLHITFPGVYAVGHKRLTRRGWMWAAQLFAGQRWCFSHATAAEIRKLIRPREGERFHMTGPSKRRYKWIHFHESRALSAKDIDTIDGLRVTSLERTLLDLAATETQRTVELAINEAIINQDFELHLLNAAVERFAGHPGLRTLKAAVKDLDEGLTPTDGEAAEALHELLRRTNFKPRPAYQPDLLGKRPDFLFEEARLIVEADGSRFHMTPMRRRKDRERDAYLRANGYEVLRFTYHQIVYEPDHVLTAIRIALDERASQAA